MIVQFNIFSVNQLLLFQLFQFICAAHFNVLMDHGDATPHYTEFLINCMHLKCFQPSMNVWMYECMNVWMYECLFFSNRSNFLIFFLSIISVIFTMSLHNFSRKMQILVLIILSKWNLLCFKCTLVLWLYVNCLIVKICSFKKCNN